MIFFHALLQLLRLFRSYLFILPRRSRSLRLYLQFKISLIPSISERFRQLYFLTKNSTLLVKTSRKTKFQNKNKNKMQTCYLASFRLKVKKSYLFLEKKSGIFIFRVNDILTSILSALISERFRQFCSFTKRSTLLLEKSRKMNFLHLFFIEQNAKLLPFNLPFAFFKFYPTFVIRLETETLNGVSAVTFPQ